MIRLSLQKADRKPVHVLKANEKNWIDLNLDGDFLTEKLRP